MEYSSLYDLIEMIERGTRMHIGVIFFGNYGNEKCKLPNNHTIHSREVCDVFKSDASGLLRCMRCRNLALKRAIRYKEPFAALCINGVYEYTHPVVISGETAAVIFIGNILTEGGLEKLKLKGAGKPIPTETMETDVDGTDCKRIAEIIDGYIRVLLEKYPNSRGTESPIINNIKDYVQSNLEYDHKLSDIASIFFYNEAYLGRLFRKECGVSFKAYLNIRRINKAKELLLSDMSVTEASTSVGYNNVTYFNRIFKQYVGCTPTEYKDKELCRGQ